MSVTSYPMLDHLVALTDDTGLIQHATHDIPNRSTGYCTDDVARGLIVAVSASRRPASAVVAKRLVTTYLAYLHDAQTHDGRFHNFMGFDRVWQDRSGSPDSLGRALWGLGYCLRHSPRSSWRAVARRLFDAALPHVHTLEHLRSRAYAALGIIHALASDHADDVVCRSTLYAALEPLAAAYAEHADSDWSWCQPTLTYDNARLAEALIRGGEALKEPRFTKLGLEMLAFYCGVVIEAGVFVPIGNNGWFERGGAKARYGQQPIEACGMVEACIAAWSATGDPTHLTNAEIAFRWFLGANTAGASMIANGGCCDGIDSHGVNSNMGAESTLAYLQSAIAIAAPSAARLRVAR